MTINNKLLLSKQIIKALNLFLDRNYRKESSAVQESFLLQNTAYQIFDTKEETIRKLESFVEHSEETFSEMLLRLIDEKGMSDVDVYKAAHLDRRLFSKIRSNVDYRPSKETAVSFALSLKLNLDEAYDLLRRAGYALSPSSKFDLIIQFFIENKIYSICKVNEALLKFDQGLLGV